MSQSANDNEKAGNSGNEDTLRIFKHDVNNQLSNILLALDQLRYEIPDASEDCLFYLDLIAQSTAKIGTLLKEID